MPSTYLFLSEKNRASGTGNPKWLNLPTISQSSRECYLTLIDCAIVFENTETYQSLNIKMRIPTNNYFSSDNEYPLLGLLETINDQVFRLPKGNEIHILTNDNLKNVELVLEDNTGEVIELTDEDSLEVMFKLDYLNQEQQTEQFILEMPKHL